MDMIERRGFFWPPSDDWCWRVIHDELPDLDVAVGLARGRQLAVQAGGNVGVWAAHLAKSFGQVITVEPMAENYACLVKNIPANVSHQLAGFGEKPGTIGMETVQGNAGAHYVRSDGGISVITIDSLDLPACDLICLDVEGYEPMALRGAEQTIRKYRPVIQIEEKGLSERYYGIPARSAEHWLIGLGLGYHISTHVRKDTILTC